MNEEIKELYDEIIKLNDKLHKIFMLCIKSDYNGKNVAKDVIDIINEKE